MIRFPPVCQWTVLRPARVILAGSPPTVQSVECGLLKNVSALRTPRSALLRVLRQGVLSLGMILVVLCWTGCTPLTHVTEDEEKNPHFQLGKTRVNSMDWNGAIEAFEKAIEANPQSGSAHFELGLLYEQRMTDFATAIYHYQKHLKLRPKSQYAETVRERIDSCKVELAKSVAYKMVSPQVHAGLDRLTTENASLRQQVEQLKAQLAQQATTLSNRNAVAPTSPVPERTVPLTNLMALRAERPSLSPAVSDQTRPTPTSLSRYVVKRGDWFAKIEREKGLSPGTLQKLNPGVDPRRLVPGKTILNVPAANR